MKLGKIALRNIFRNGRRSMLSALAVAVAAMSITLLFTLYAGVLDDIRENAWNFETGEVRIRNIDYDRYEHLNPVQYVVPNYRLLTEELQKMSSVEAVSPRINIPALIFQGERQISTYGIGIDFELERNYQDLERLLMEGRLPKPESSEAVLAYGLARELGIGVGDTATFLTQTRNRGTNAFTVDVSGLVSFGVAAMNSRAFLLPIENAERYLRMSGGATEIFLIASGAGGTGLKPGTAAGESSGINNSRDSGITGLPDEFFKTWDDRRGRDLAAAVNGWLTSRPETRNWEQIYAAPWNETSSGYVFSSFAAVVYNIMGLLFFLLAGTVIVNTTMMTINERTHEIGTLSAMGMGRGDLVRLFFTESVILGVAGSLAGVAAGILIAIPLGQVGLDMGARLDKVDMNISSMVYPVIELRFVVWVFVYSSVVAMITSIIPASRAARLKPVEALRA